MGAVRVLFGLFCLAGVCSSGVFSGGSVNTSSSRTAGRDLSSLTVQRSLFATLIRDDGCNNDERNNDGMLIRDGGMFSGGAVGTSSSRTAGRDLSSLAVQRSLFATLIRDDGCNNDERNNNGMLIRDGGVFSGGAVGTSSSRTAGRDLSSLAVQRSLFATLIRDDGRNNDGCNNDGMLIRDDERNNDERNNKRKNEYERVIEIARGEIGVMEKGCQNCGARVAGYLDYVGVKTPAPWCAAWVSWCYGQAGYREPKTAWSPALFPEGRIVREAIPGSVFGVYFPELKRVAHCGIVAGVKGDYVQTIEGNTNRAGGREGIGVFRKLRHKRSIAKYADWIRPVPP